MVRNLAEHLDMCSINTATLGFQSPISDVIEAVARAGFGHIAPWRREIEGQNIAAVSQQIRDAKLKLSGYCRSTFIPAATGEEFRANIAANRRALDDAAVLGAPVFVMVVGGLPAGSKDLDAARAQVKEAVAELVDHGRKIGVRIGLEPLHPVYAADRSCLTLLSEALSWCNEIEGDHPRPMLGTVIDCYHVWWDPHVITDIATAGNANRIFGFHVSDWLVPTQDVLNDRGMMGDGVINVRRLRASVETAGYQGAVEVELFSAQNWWKRPMSETLAACKQRFASAT